MALKIHAGLTPPCDVCSSLMHRRFRPVPNRAGGHNDQTHLEGSPTDGSRRLLQCGELPHRPGGADAFDGSGTLAPSWVVPDARRPVHRRTCCILEPESGPVQLASRVIGESLRSGWGAFIGEGGEAKSRYRVSSNTGAWSLVPTLDWTTQRCVRANRPGDASM
jgi:hypothetical protein